MAAIAFKPGRKQFSAMYQSIDGTETEVTFVSLTTNEDISTGIVKEGEHLTHHGMFERAVRIHLQLNDPQLIDKIIAENKEHASIIDFGMWIGQQFIALKAGK